VQHHHLKSTVHVSDVPRDGSVPPVWLHLQVHTDRQASDGCGSTSGYPWHQATHGRRLRPAAWSPCGLPAAVRHPCSRPWRPSVVAAAAWMVQLWDPQNKRKEYIGRYASYEDAARAYGCAGQMHPSATGELISEPPASRTVDSGPSLLPPGLLATPLQMQWQQSTPLIGVPQRLPPVKTQLPCYRAGAILGGAYTCVCYPL
jgi:hypothetical protein